MIDYVKFAEYAPPATGTVERNKWFVDHGYDPDDLVQVGREVAEYRLADLAEGDRISADELLLAMTLAFCFGFELAVRCERDEKPDLSLPDSNGRVS